MVGRGRGAILGLRSEDPVLSTVGALGLAASFDTCLVVDFAATLALDAPRTLAEIESEGPELRELSPGRGGIAVISRGRLDPGRAKAVVEELATRWPAVVVRLGGDAWEGPTVPLVGLYPGWLAQSTTSPSVWQPIGSHRTPPAPGPVLPRLRGGVAMGLLSGRLPSRSKWIDAWREVWELPWA